MHEHSIGSDTGVHDVFSSTISIEASEHPGFETLMGETVNRRLAAAKEPRERGLVLQ